MSRRKAALAHPRQHVADASRARHPNSLSALSQLNDSGALTVKALNQIRTGRGKSPPADAYVDAADGFALVVKAGSNTSTHGLLVVEGADYIEKSVYDDMPDSCKVIKGDVLLASTGEGTLGKAIVYGRSMPAIADGHVTIIRVDASKISPYYLADYLRCGFGAAQISRLFTGSTGLIELTPERVDELLIPMPTLQQQWKLSRSIRHAEAQFRRATTRTGFELAEARKTFAKATGA